jgi:ABC-type sulfate transport system permease component
MARGQMSLPEFFSQTLESNTHELFSVLLLLANLVVAALLLRGAVDLLLGGAVMFLVAVHSYVGARLAPDPLTSGAMLLVNVLVFYTGAKLHRHLPIGRFAAFVASYFALFFIFMHIEWHLVLPWVRWLPGVHGPLRSGLANAEPLFLLFALVLCGAIRSWRLFAYFWCATLSFTFAQPYAWEAVILSFFLVTALFGARDAANRPAALVFLGAGMALAFLVLMPAVNAILGGDLRDVEAVLRNPRVMAAVGRTLWTATVSTAFLVVLAVPLAYALSRLRFPGRTLLLSMIDLPIVIPQSVAGLALVRVFGERAPLGEALQDTLGIGFSGTEWGICLAQIFVALPFIVKASLAAFDNVPPELEAAARTLGESSWGAFRRVALPLASRGIYLGAVLAWARAAGEFGALLFIAATPETAPVAAWNQAFGRFGEVEAGALVAVLLGFSLVMFFLLQVAVRTLPRPAAARGEEPGT